jgi:site-specific DNA-methyltransferase (adenine-specific)
MNDECLVNYKYYFSDRFNLFKGDSRQVLPLMKDNSIDSVVCDPPYELGFMGKSWDSTGVANDVNLWKEVLRVLKPGGHLLSFGGSRTYHRMAVAIEDAGFEIRDQIMWVYGSGFPKSLNIGKQLDEWKGWGTALKPAHEPIVLARKPVEGTVANNVLTFGVGGINIDGTRVGSQGGSTRGDKPSTHLSPSGAFNTGHDILKLNAGRFPANFIHDGSDEVVELFPDTKGKIGMSQQASTRGLYEGGTSFGDTKISDGISDSGSAARFFYCAKASKRDRNEGCDEFQ